MVNFRFFFELVDTTSRRSIISCSKKELSPNGEMRADRRSTRSWPQFLFPRTEEIQIGRTVSRTLRDDAKARPGRHARGIPGTGLSIKGSLVTQVSTSQEVQEGSLPGVHEVVIHDLFLWNGNWSRSSGSLSSAVSPAS